MIRTRVKAVRKSTVCKTTKTKVRAEAGTRSVVRKKPVKTTVRAKAVRKKSVPRKSAPSMDLVNKPAARHKSGWISRKLIRLSAVVIIVISAGTMGTAPPFQPTVSNGQITAALPDTTITTTQPEINDVETKLNKQIDELSNRINLNTDQLGKMNDRTDAIATKLAQQQIATEKEPVQSCLAELNSSAEPNADETIYVSVLILDQAGRQSDIMSWVRTDRIFQTGNVTRVCQDDKFTIIGRGAIMLRSHPYTRADPTGGLCNIIYFSYESDQLGHTVKKINATRGVSACNIFNDPVTGLICYIGADGGTYRANPGTIVQSENPVNTGEKK